VRERRRPVSEKEMKSARAKARRRERRPAGEQESLSGRKTARQRGGRAVGENEGVAGESEGSLDTEEPEADEREAHLALVGQHESASTRRRSRLAVASGGAKPGRNGTNTDRKPIGAGPSQRQQLNYVARSSPDDEPRIPNQVAHQCYATAPEQTFGGEDGTPDSQ
jgi:hypothetical protein